MKIRILNKSDLAKVLSMKETIAAMRECFLELQEQQVTMPQRTVINIPKEEATALFMPALLSRKNQLGIKVVSVFPKNMNNKLPAINGAVLLLDSHTGEPKAFIDAGLLTALRTGAVSGLATDLVAANNATHLALIGAGVQAKTQLEAVLCVRNIDTVTVYSRNINHAQQFAKDIQNTHPKLKIRIEQTVARAVTDAEIICTATNSTEPFLFMRDLKDGCHINAIGSHSALMQEIDLSIVRKAHNIVDQKSAAIAEAGELINALQQDAIKSKDLIELGALIVHPSEQESLKSKLTLFKSVGLAIQDLAAAEKALAIAEQSNVGNIIHF